MFKQLQILLLLILLIGCSEPTAELKTGTAEDAFEQIRRVRFDTAIAATIGDLRDVAVLSDRYLVTDWMTDRVLSFDADGVFLGAFGRHGDGPGEFNDPRVIELLPDGSLAVLQSTPRITRISPDLELLSTEDVAVRNFPTDMINANGKLYLFQWVSRTAGDNYVEWIPGEGLGRSFDPRNELVLEVPYWNARWNGRAATSRTAIFVADNMVYPLRRYPHDLQRFDTVGTAKRPSQNSVSSRLQGQTLRRG